MKEHRGSATGKGALTRRSLIRKSLIIGGGVLTGPTVRTRLIRDVDAPAFAAVSQPARRNQVILTLFGLPTRIVGSVEVTAFYILLLVHDVLARPDWKTGKVVPRLAERWTRSADGRSYVVRLRNARFQDGQPVTAEDVKFSYEFYLHPQYPLVNADLLEIQGAQPYRQGKAGEVSGITIVDPMTIRFTLEGHYAFFEESVLGSNHYIMPKHGWSGVSMGRMLEHPYARRPIGAGPYRLVDWKERDSIILEGFPEYWGGRPSVERVIVRWIPEPSTLEAELRAGNVDAASILVDDFPTFERDARFRPLRMGAEFCYWCSFNHKHPFFQDVRVRRALFQAIDRETMVRALAKGYGRVVNSIIPPESRLYNTSLQGYRYNPDRAQELLREAGFVQGPGGILHKGERPFRVRYSFLSEKRYQDVGLIIQEYLRRVGVDLTLEPLERGDFFGRFWQPSNAANIEMVGLSLYTVAPIAPLQGSLESVFDSSGAWARNLQYQNSEVDALLRRATTAVDPGALRTIYVRLQEVLNDDVAWITLFRPGELWAVRKRIAIPEVHELAQLFDSVGRWQVA